jgi:hypothetical protein
MPPGRGRFEALRLLVQRQQQRLGTEDGSGWYTHLAVHSFTIALVTKPSLCTGESP